MPGKDKFSVPNIIRGHTLGAGLPYQGTILSLPANVEVQGFRAPTPTSVSEIWAEVLTPTEL